MEIKNVNDEIVMLRDLASDKVLASNEIRGLDIPVEDLRDAMRHINRAKAEPLIKYVYEDFEPLVYDTGKRKVSADEVRDYYDYILENVYNGYFTEKDIEFIRERTDAFIDGHKDVIKAVNESNGCECIPEPEELKYKVYESVAFYYALKNLY